MTRARRRVCLALLGLAASRFAIAQPPHRKVRVGVVFWGAPAAPRWPSLRAELEKRGWVDGRNLELIVRSADRDDTRIPGLLDELIALPVDLIVAGSNSVAREAKRRTRHIPIVVARVFFPVEEGLVISLSRPGGNLTGTHGGGGFEAMGKLLGLLKDAAPSVTRMAYLSDDRGLAVDRLDRAGVNEDLIPNTFVEAARKLGIALKRWAVDTPQQLERAFDTFKGDRVNGLYVDTGRNLARTAELAVKHRLPSCYGHGQDAVPLGGLMGYNPIDDAPRVAAFVDKILRGAKPGELPMEEPTRFELWLNVKTAKALGLTIPESLRVQVDRVFE